MNFPPLDAQRFSVAKERLLAQVPLEYNHQLCLNLHGLNLTWRVQDKAVLDKLRTYFPKAWETQPAEDSLVIYWRNSFEESFWESENPDCQVESLEEGEIALQRDFAAFYRADKSIELHTEFGLYDGFYNFLRWLLPRRWIAHSRLLLHSSCVIDEEGMAHICLGVSGAGKSTIASLVPKTWTILGDDMNLIRKKGNSFFACASAVGQAMESLKDFGKEFPIAGFYGLEKAQFNHLQPQAFPRFYTKLASSCANLFWDQLKPSEHQAVHDFLSNLCQQSKYYKLEFNKQGGVWDYVQQQRKNL